MAEIPMRGIEILPKSSPVFGGVAFTLFFCKFSRRLAKVAWNLKLSQDASANHTSASPPTNQQQYSSLRRSECFTCEALVALSSVMFRRRAICFPFVF